MNQPNAYVIGSMSGGTIEYYHTNDEAADVIAEYLHTTNAQGMPPHQLKVGMPIILLRNLPPAAGLLADGTRLMLR